METDRIPTRKNNENRAEFNKLFKIKQHYKYVM